MKTRTESQLILKVITTGVSAALIFAVTFAIKIPLGGAGYFNLGDTAIYICAYIFGGPITAIAAAIGSGLSDFLAGYGIYVIPTVIIKGLMGLLVGYMARKEKFAPYLITSFIAGIVIMAGGYTLFEFFYYDLLSNEAMALVNLPGNLLQGVVGAVVAVALYPASKRLKTIASKTLLKERQ